MYEIYGLKCNGLKNPQGIVTKQPCFSWKLKCNQNGTKQTTYSLKVTDEKGKVVWQYKGLEES